MPAGVNGVLSVVLMHEVRARCGLCDVRRRVCRICFPDVRSERALHEATPRGWVGSPAHCEACHHRFVEMTCVSPCCPSCGSRDAVEIR